MIGLDIGLKEIRVIGANVEARIATPKDAFADDVIVKKDVVAAALKDLFASRKIKDKRVAVAIGGKRVVLHIQDIPFMEPEAIKKTVQETACQYMVFGGSDILTDFHILERAGDADAGRLKILAVAAKKEIIDSYVETAKLAGLNLQAIDVGSLSLARTISAQENLSEGIVILAVVENEYDSATIFIFKEGKVYYLHNVDSVDELESEMESIAAFCGSEFGENAPAKKIISSTFKNISAATGLLSRGTKETGFPINIDLLVHH